MNPLQTLTEGVPGVLLAGLALLSIPALARHVWLRAGGLLLAAAGGVCLAILIGQEGPDAWHLWKFWDWLSLPQLPEGAVTLSLRLDWVAAMLLAATLLAACVGTLVSSSSLRQPEAFWPSVYAHLLAATLALLSDHLLLFFLFWQLVSAADFRLLSLAFRDDFRNAQRVFLGQRLTDLAFLAGIGLYWKTFGTFSLTPLLDDPFFVTANQQPAASLMGYCFLIPALARCAQFPFFNWLRQTTAAPAPCAALAQVASGSLGVSLLIRCLPLLDVEMLLAVGLLTCGLSALVSLAQREFSEALFFLTAGAFGWTLFGLATGGVAGIPDAVCCWIAGGSLQLLLLTLSDNFPSAEPGALRFPYDQETALDPLAAWRGFLLASLLIGSGICGPAQLIGQAAAVAGTMVDVTEEPSGSSFPTAPFWGLVCLGLLAVAHARLACQLRARCLPELAPASSRFRLALLTVGMTLPAAASWLLREAPGQPLWLAGATAFGLLAFGGICWLEFRRPHWDQRLREQALVPFVLLENGLFLEDGFYLLATLPVRAGATLIRFFDWFLIDTLLFGCGRLVPWGVRLLAEPLHRRPVRFYALSLLLTTAILLLLFLRAGG